MSRVHARAIAVALVASAILIGHAPVQGWGMDVHRLLTRRALHGLPEPLRAFLIEKEEFIVEHAADPDLWRIADLRGAMGIEDPNHFLDLDGLDEARPFSHVPRDRSAFLARYGEARAEKMGRLPWRTEEVYGRLVDAFKNIGRQTYAADNAKYLSSVLSHYVEDACQPFHAVVNYDGQATGQRGIHARFETELVLRNWPGLHLAPVTVKPVPNIIDFTFDTLADSEQAVAAILDADRRAHAGDAPFDQAYYDAFLARVRPTLEARLSEAASHVASVLVAAWADAGKPVLPLREPAVVPAAR